MCMVPHTGIRRRIGWNRWNQFDQRWFGALHERHERAPFSAEGEGIVVTDENAIKALDASLVGGKTSNLFPGQSRGTDLDATMTGAAAGWISTEAMEGVVTGIQGRPQPEESGQSAPPGGFRPGTQLVLKPTHHHGRGGERRSSSRRSMEIQGDANRSLHMNLGFERENLFANRSPQVRDLFDRVAEKAADEEIDAEDIRPPKKAAETSGAPVEWAVAFHDDEPIDDRQDVGNGLGEGDEVVKSRRGQLGTIGGPNEALEASGRHDQPGIGVRAQSRDVDQEAGVERRAGHSNLAGGHSDPYGRDTVEIQYADTVAGGEPVNPKTFDGLDLGGGDGGRGGIPHHDAPESPIQEGFNRGDKDPQVRGGAEESRAVAVEVRFQEEPFAAGRKHGNHFIQACIDSGTDLRGCPCMHLPDGMVWDFVAPHPFRGTFHGASPPPLLRSMGCLFG